MIAPAAVEAAAAYMHDEEGYFETFDGAPDFRKEHFREKAAGILEAVAPHMLAGLAESRVVEDGVELFRFTSTQREWLRGGGE